MTAMSAFPLETLFSAAGSLAMAGWLALILVPLRYRAPRAAAVAAAIVIAMLYAGLVGAFWTRGEGGFGTLAEVARLFEHRGLLLAGWVHYLAFDLLVGLWERDEARRIGLPQWALAPCLILTFLLGPLGWLAFLAVRFFRSNPVAPAAAPAG
jgi:hypothetical protein